MKCFIYHFTILLLLGEITDRNYRTAAHAEIEKVELSVETRETWNQFAEDGCTKCSEQYQQHLMCLVI